MLEVITMMPNYVSNVVRKLGAIAGAASLAANIGCAGAESKIYTQGLDSCKVFGKTTTCIQNGYKGPLPEGVPEGTDILVTATKDGSLIEYLFMGTEQDVRFRVIEPSQVSQSDATEYLTVVRGSEAEKAIKASHDSTARRTIKHENEEKGQK